MPSPQSGKACTPIAPVAPKEPVEALKADPGEVTKASGGGTSAATGSQTSTKVKRFTGQPPMAAGGDAAPASAAAADEPAKSGWVEVVLKDEEGNPLAGEPYQITLPDGSVAEGTLGADGSIKVSGFEPGACKLSFPNLDQDAWG